MHICKFTWSIWWYSPHIKETETLSLEQSHGPCSHPRPTERQECNKVQRTDTRLKPKRHIPAIGKLIAMEKYCGPVLHRLASSLANKGQGGRDACVQNIH